MLKEYSRQIAKWTLIGLLVRITLMPITMHGQDLVFINYFPFIFVEKGIWDPYGFISANFPYFPATYYGPVLFFIMSAVNFIIIKLFHPASLVTILELSSEMMAKGLTTVDYVHAFSGLELFQNLFLMKSPYLVFDFFIGWILLKLAISQESKLIAYKLWMLNIVVLQSVYMVGGAYLVPAFFIVTALYAAQKERPYLCVILLSMGGATMLFPYFLILPTCLLLGGNWKNRCLLLLTGSVATTLLYLPFYLSSGNAVFGFFASSGNVQYTGVIRWILLGTFSTLYFLVSVNAAQYSRTSNPQEKLLYYFVIVMFLCYAAFPSRFRYFVFITPFLALIIPHHKKFGMFTLLIILMLAFSWLTTRSLQLGLFSPLDPEYFSNIPTLQEILDRFINIEIVYKITTRVLLLMFFIAAWWVWRIKQHDEKEKVVSC